MLEPADAAGDSTLGIAAGRAGKRRRSLLGTIVADAHWCATNCGEAFPSQLGVRESISVVRLLFAADNFPLVVLVLPRADRR